MWYKAITTSLPGLYSWIYVGSKMLKTSPLKNYNFAAKWLRRNVIFSPILELTNTLDKGLVFTTSGSGSSWHTGKNQEKIFSWYFPSAGKYGIYLGLFQVYDAQAGSLYTGGILYLRKIMRQKLCWEYISFSEQNLHWQVLLLPVQGIWTSAFFIFNSSYTDRTGYE